SFNGRGLSPLDLYRSPGAHCLNIQYFCFEGFVCQGMNHLFFNFGEHTAGLFVIDLPYRADVVWR
ncbi:hypothetical protein, partial [Enterobacter roggenkampii]|uniref:hypothetical protein n=1 Tax=Enterobacter roggenkampii TaxID=1812935 RepID=UPI0021076D33